MSLEKGSDESVQDSVNVKYLYFSVIIGIISLAAFVVVAIEFGVYDVGLYMGINCIDFAFSQILLVVINSSSSSSDIWNVMISCMEEFQKNKVWYWCLMANIKTLTFIVLSVLIGCNIHIKYRVFIISSFDISILIVFACITMALSKLFKYVLRL